MVSVKWSDKALAGVAELDHVIRERVLTKITWLEENISRVLQERLHHDLRDLYKLRVGDYRVFYSVSSTAITIEAVRHRRDAYK